MTETDIRAKRAYDTISRANKEAYKDVFMMSNPVLSKTPSNNGFLAKCVCGDIPKKPLSCVVFCKLAVYYAKSCLHYLMYLFRFTEYAMASLPPCLNSDRDELILIDVPFLCASINKSGSFRDAFFPGLERVLRNKEKSYAYLPYFYSSTYNKKPLELLRTLKILKKENVKAITEYQLLSAGDLLGVIKFIAVYPFHVLRFSRTLSGGAEDAKALEYELIHTIDQVTFYNYIRYLVGRKVADMSYKDIKIISCYENQALHKNLYRGARSNSSKKITIVGAQLFLRSRHYLNVFPDENESSFGVLPDKIIVNGAYYMPDTNNLTYEVGPSLRYAGMFDIAVKEELRKDILVLLPYFIEDARNILRVLFRSKSALQKIFIKAHPATPINDIKQLISSNAVVVEKGIYQLLETAKIVIGAASGTMVEAASIGIPVISIKNGERFEWNNPLPEYGKGIIWEEAVNAEGLDRQIERFEKKLKECPQEISVVAARYKEMFFCRPTDENIIKAFEL